MELERHTTIQTTPQNLWALLTETEQLKKWLPELVDDQPLEAGPPGVGSRSVMIIREGGREVEYQTEITRWEPGRLLAMQLREGSLGLCPMDLTYEISSQASGEVTLRYNTKWSPRGVVLRVLYPLIWLAGRRNLTHTLRRLKAHAESQSSQPSGANS